MSFMMVLGLLLLVCLIVYSLVARRVVAASARGSSKFHSRPQYHGAYVAMLAGLPAFFLALFWVFLEPGVLRARLLASLPQAQIEGLGLGQLSLVLAQIEGAAAGRVVGSPDQFILEAGDYLVWLREVSGWLMAACVLAVAIAGAALALRSISPQFRARTRVERITSGLFILSSCIAIGTTLGIIMSLVIESWHFFSMVPISEFLFGLNWEPQIPIREDQIAGAGAFGALPVFWGTIFISMIAMLVAIPVGLFSAIYMSTYASHGVRAVVKPMLEILAGVPTIVYGFFAVLTVAPALRGFAESIGVEMAANSALIAGSVMGVMIIPFISSFADDAINAVPLSLRDGSLAIGATRAETVRKVLLPAALPGIVGGILLAVSRAIGETMIVAMAAGLIARFTLNPLEGVTTVTVQIVTLLTGDTAFDNPKTLAAFGLGLSLFLTTLALNVAALQIVKRYREQYD